MTLSVLCLQTIGLLGVFGKSRKSTVSFVLSVCLSPWNNYAPTGRIFVNFDI